MMHYSWLRSAGAEKVHSGKFTLNFARLSASVAFAAIAPMVSTAVAQDDTVVDQESRQDVVIVTATKREASIQEIPISISQVSGDDLEAQGIQNIENLTYIVPGLEFGSNGGSTYTTIRGIGTTSTPASPSLPWQLMSTAYSSRDRPWR